MFLFGLLALLAMVYGYSSWRLLGPVQLSLTGQIVAWTGVFLLLSMVPGLFFLKDRIAGKRWGDILSWITYLNLGFATLTFGLVAFRDLLWAGIFLLTHLYAVLLPGANDFHISAILSLGPGELLRYSNLAVLGLALVLCIWGYYQARRKPRVTSVSVPIDSLPQALDGFRIVQFSDVHAGPTIKRPQVQAIVDQIEKLAADLITCTGDLADRTVSQLADDVAPLAQLKAPHGCFFVTGNHEYYAGAEAWIEALKKLGFEVLLNQHRILEHGDGRILLAGVTDFNAGEILPHHTSDPRAAIAQAPRAQVRILLAHQPRSIDAAVKAGFDLQLSGHTHGGQFPPWKYIVTLQQPYLKGLHKRARTWVYINRGAGYWGPPLRLGAPAEIALITLKKAGEN